jgi:type I restriction enzyme S subunit
MTKKSQPKWRLEPVSAVADVNPTTSLPHGLRTVPCYEMASIDETTGELREPAIVGTDSGQSGRSKFRNGDVLFARITPCVQNRKSALVRDLPGDFALGSTEFYVLRSKRTVISEYLFYFLRQQKIVDAAVASFTGTSGRQRVPRSFWDSLTIPVPPLPVQERIVQILQKADEIRRKRREALELADKILPALFLEMFGDPIDPSRKYPAIPLGECAEIRRGISKRPTPKGSVPIVRIKNLTLQGLDLSWSEKIEASDAEISRGRLLDGDIVFSPLNGSILHLAKSDVFTQPKNGETWVLDSNLCAFRAKKDVVKPEFLASWISHPSVQEHLRTRLAVRTSGGQWLLKNATLAAINVPVPPLSEQDYFVTQVERYLGSRSKLAEAQRSSSAALSSLLSRAFTGELTAEWEAANAEEIAAQQALHERLPRLLLLALLVEKAKRANRAVAEVLVTALMKYAFLLQMEGNGGRRRLYHFVPYHYGPFAKELYTDLQALQQEGLVRVDNDSEEDKTKITMVDSTRADKALAALPDDLKEDAAAIIETYGDLGHNALLKAVYEKYPAYAKKSRLRRARGAGQPQRSPGRRGRP